MSEELCERLRDFYIPDEIDNRIYPAICIEAADRIEALNAEVARLREALDAAWKQATTMRNASKLVSPYPYDHAKRSVWARSLYHEGKRLHELLKPIRAALGDEA